MKKLHELSHAGLTAETVKALRALTSLNHTPGTAAVFQKWGVKVISEWDRRFAAAKRLKGGQG